MNTFNEDQLQHVLTFTAALADKLEQENNPNFAEMETTSLSLDAAEKEAREYAERRKAGLTARSTYGKTDSEEVDSIREGIREYYRRTRKVVTG